MNNIVLDCQTYKNKHRTRATMCVRVVASFSIFVVMEAWQCGQVRCDGSGPTAGVTEMKVDAIISLKRAHDNGENQWAGFKTKFH